jgi:hypothetical protein
MKSILILVTLLTATTSFATIKCPEVTVQKTSCKSTPQEGDSEVLAGLITEVKICQKADKNYIIAMESEDGEDMIGDATRTIRVGGASYVTDTKDLDFKLEIVHGINPFAKNNAKLSMIFVDEGGSITSTYTCR